MMPVVVALLLLLLMGSATLLLARDLFRQTAPHQDPPTQRDRPTEVRPVPPPVAVVTERWTALDDVQLARLLRHPPGPAAGSTFRSESEPQSRPPFDAAPER